MATNKLKMPNGSGGYKTVGSDADKIDLVAATPYFMSSSVDGALAETGQKIGTLGDISDLETTDKTSLVAAINENVTQLAETTADIKQITAPYNYSGPIAVFTDDDAPSAFLTNLKPTIDSKGVKVTIGVITNFVGLTGNMTVAQLLDLQAQGHEIVSHSKSHSASYYRDNIATTPDSVYDDEFGGSKQWLKDNGFGDVDTLIWPYGGFGVNAARLKALARKYYSNAANSQGAYNPSPSDNMYLNRIFLVKTTSIATVQAQIDTCIANNGLIIFGTHSGNSAQIDGAYLGQVIDYLQSHNVPIMTLGDALRVKGNVLSVGEFTGTGFFVGPDGKSNASTNLKIIQGDYSGLFADAVTTYEQFKLTITQIQSAKDTLTGLGGEMYTYHGNQYYSHQIYVTSNGQRIFLRNWNEAGGYWNTFIEFLSAATLASSQALKVIQGLVSTTGPLSSRTMDDAITTYDQYKETVLHIHSSKDTYLSVGGTLKVYRGEAYFSFALYYPSNDNTIRKRRWDEATSSWGAWAQV